VDQELDSRTFSRKSGSQDDNIRRLGVDSGKGTGKKAEVMVPKVYSNIAKELRSSECLRSVKMGIAFVISNTA